MNEHWMKGRITGGHSANVCYSITAYHQFLIFPEDGSYIHGHITYSGVIQKVKKNQP